jgi:hypothetical protein
MKEYYNNLLNSFTTTARSSEIEVNYAPSKTFNYKFPDNSGKSHLQVLRPLHLRNCKTRSGTIIDIIISFTEDFDVKDEKITIQSRVGVAYFKVNLESHTADLVLGLHYDFEACDEAGEPKPRHPRFHAQVSVDVIKGEEINKVAETFTYSVKFPASLETNEVARIPTAHMCLASVLMSIAADFFKNEDFKKFMHDVRTYADVYPKPYTNILLKNMTSDKSSLRSCSWYHSHEEQQPPRALQGGRRGNLARRRAV